MPVQGSWIFSNRPWSEQVKRRLPQPRELFKAVECQKFGASTCFLCGRRLGKKNRSDEHVIPEWLQERFNLWDMHLTLLNGTSIPYRKLTIPCCDSCNNEVLSPIEERIASATKSGVKALQELPTSALFIWLSKLMYGLLYKEGFLRADRRSQRKAAIVPRAMLERFGMLHQFMQSCRLPLTFNGFHPASIYIVECQEPKVRELGFDFRDSTPSLAISIRIGSVGILAALQDGGAHLATTGEYMSGLAELALHPLQFEELTAKFIYHACKFNRVPKYLFMEGPKGIEVVQMPLQGVSRKPLFDPWVHREYADCLAQQTGLPADKLFVPPDKLMTWLQNEDGDFCDLSFERQPWPVPGSARA